MSLRNRSGDRNIGQEENQVFPDNTSNTDDVNDTSQNSKILVVGGDSSAETRDYIDKLKNVVANVTKKSEDKNATETKSKDENVIETEKEIDNITENTEKMYEENNETTKIEESNEVEENSEETTIIEQSSQTQDNIENNGDIPVEIGGGTDPELLDKFKQECKAILDKDNKIFDDLISEIEKKIDDLEPKLSDKVKQDIMNNIQENYKDDEKLEKYINSFEEGSYERQYAETFANFRAYLDLDEESSLSKDQKLEALISRYNSQGLEIPQEVSKMKDSKDLDRLTLVNSQDEETENRRKNIVMNNYQQDKEAENRRKNIIMTNYQQDNQANLKSYSNEASIKPDPRINDIKDVELKATMSDLAKIDSTKFRVHGKLEGEIDTKAQSDIQADFETRINSLSENLGIEPSSINKIFNSMDEKAQRQFNDYKLGKIKPSELNGSAKDLAIVEREAEHLSKIRMASDRLQFDMSVNGSNYIASSSNEVINNLQREREKITITEGGRTQGRNITMTEDGKNPKRNISINNSKNKNKDKEAI